MPSYTPHPPDSYPAAFHAIVRAGSGVLHCDGAGVRWSPASTIARFRFFIRDLRASSHPLSVQASALRWHIVRQEEGILWIESTPLHPAPK